MTTIYGFMFLAVFGWIFAGVGLALLHRGIQITWMKPMIPLEEQRLNLLIRRAAPPVLFVAGVCCAAFGQFYSGLAAVVAAPVMLVWSFKRDSWTVDEPGGAHAARPDESG